MKNIFIKGPEPELIHAGGLFLGVKVSMNLLQKDCRVVPETYYQEMLKEIEWWQAKTKSKLIKITNQKWQIDELRNELYNTKIRTGEIEP